MQFFPTLGITLAGFALSCGTIALPSVCQSADSSDAVTICTVDNAPKTPAVTELPLQTTLTQYGITWTFAAPVHIGQFVNGDWYIVGPATVVDITPKPENGRNGSCRNITTIEKIGFDSRIPHGRFDPALVLQLPIALKPGDSLASSISVGKVGDGSKMLWKQGEIVSPVKTVAVLTCLTSPVPKDAFRPAYCGKEHRIFLARNLKRELLPRIARTPGTPKLAEY